MPMAQEGISSLGRLTIAHPNVFGHPISLHFCRTRRGMYCWVSNQP